MWIWLGGRGGDTSIQFIAMGYKGDLLYLKLLQLYMNILKCHWNSVVTEFTHSYYNLKIVNDSYEDIIPLVGHNNINI